MAIERSARRAARHQPAIAASSWTAPVLATAAVFALVLLAAPPDSNHVWAVNGWRSVGWPVRLALLAAAGVGALLIHWGARSRAAFLGAACFMALIAAFPWRVAVDLLGDSQLRLRSLSAFTAGIITSPFA